MRSAEASGGEAGGFGHRLRQLLAQVSPRSYVVAVTALLAATLFVASDLARTENELARHAELLTQLDAAQPLLGRQFMTTAFEPQAVESGSSDAVTGLLQRGAVAYGFAFLLIGVAFRRRQPVTGAPGAAPPATYQNLIATIPFGVACWTVDGRLLACNEQYRARLDTKPSEIRVGASYAALVKRLVHGGHMRMVIEDERSRLIELHRQDGSCLMIDERPLAEGGFVTLITDVTERRRADHLLASIREEQRVLARRYHEEKLRAEAASRSKTSFLAHLSHDIRTPLNHIIGFAELIRHETYGPLGDRRYADYIDTIHMSGERLLSYFASILELAEFEGGRRPQRLERVDADDLLAAMTRRFAAQAGQAGLALRIGSRCGAAVHADRFSLERMLINLVDNALRFTPAGGRVTLSAYAALDGVVLEITDTGIGIAPERLETLSQPFAFRDDVLTREQPGCGLGIAIARAIAETSGGHLAIDSRIGLGTTVAISLPLQPAASAAQAIAA